MTRYGREFDLLHEELRDAQRRLARHEQSSAVLNTRLTVLETRVDAASVVAHQRTEGRRWTIGTAFVVVTSLVGLLVALLLKQA
jgi:hypothetical protein